MKQIFDWLRGAILDKAFEGYNGQTLVDIHDVGNIINEAEAKWEADCCEYIHVEGVGYCSSGCGGYAHDYMLVSEWGFCPHCGKPIKISEVE